MGKHNFSGLLVTQHPRKLVAVLTSTDLPLSYPSPPRLLLSLDLASFYSSPLPQSERGGSITTTGAESVSAPATALSLQVPLLGTCQVSSSLYLRPPPEHQQACTGH